MTRVNGYSRWSGRIPLLSRVAADLYVGWRHLVSTVLQGVPKTLVWDGDGAVGQWHARQPELTGDSAGEACQAAADHVYTSPPTVQFPPNM